MYLFTYHLLHLNSSLEKTPSITLPPSPSLNVTPLKPSFSRQQTKSVRSSMTQGLSVRYGEMRPACQSSTTPRVSTEHLFISSYNYYH